MRDGSFAVSGVPVVVTVGAPAGHDGHGDGARGMTKVGARGPLTDQSVDGHDGSFLTFPILF